MVRFKKIKPKVFPFGLVNSKKPTILISDDKKYIFITDFLTTSRYPNTLNGMLNARRHIIKNNKITKLIKKDNKKYIKK